MASAVVVVPRLLPKLASRAGSAWRSGVTRARRRAGSVVTTPPPPRPPMANEGVGGLVAAIRLGEVMTTARCAGIGSGVWVIACATAGATVTEEGAPEAEAEAGADTAEEAVQAESEEAPDDMLMSIGAGRWPPLGGVLRQNTAGERLPNV